MTSTPTTVLITGIAGQIGAIAYNRLRQYPADYVVHGLARTPHPRRKGAALAENHTGEILPARYHLADLTDYDAVAAAMVGIDVVVHLAANASSRAPWETILQSNIVGTAHVLQAAQRAGVRRIVFASTIQTMFGYWEEPPVTWLREGALARLPDPLPRLTADTPTRPTSYYAASKVWGEAQCRVYAEQGALSCLCLRIGGVPVADRPNLESRGHWCSHRDLAQLIQRCIDAPPTLRYGIYYGVSNNTYSWLDISNARQELGYAPLDDAEAWLGNS